MTFDYKCGNKNCGKQFSFLHIPRDSKAVCPYCSSCVSERVFAASGNFQLKGSGWASDNYGLKKKR